MSKNTLILLAALPLALSACIKITDDPGEGSGMSIDLSDDDTSADKKIQIGGEEDSRFSIKADGFAMEIDLPSITLDSDDFDMNNVDLYPGSQVTSFDIEDTDGDGGKVQIGFKAPASLEMLADWYETELSANDFDVARADTSFAGKTEKGDAFSLELTAISEKETKGLLEFSER